MVWSNQKSLRVAACDAKGVLAVLVGLQVGCLWLPCHAGTFPKLLATLAGLKVGSLWPPCHAGTLPRLHRVLEQQWLLNPSHAQPGRGWDSSRDVTLGEDPQASHFSPRSAAHLVSAVDLESLCLCFCHMSLSLWQLGSCSRVMLIYWQ